MKTKGLALSSQHLPLRAFQISTCLPPVLRERSSWVERCQDCDLEDSGPLRFCPSYPGCLGQVIGLLEAVFSLSKRLVGDFLGGSVVKNPPAMQETDEVPI